MRGPKRYRFLTDAEIELWRHVAETVAPRPGRSLPAKTLPASAPFDPPEPAPPARKPDFVVPAYAPPQFRPRADAPPLAPIERQFLRRVSRGQVGIERVIDLHGLTQAEAHGALRSFLRNAQIDGLRLLLVVTGKGQRTRLSPEARGEVGVLRRAVPHWLREPDLRHIVLGFEEASQPHGGSGALYVRLRQRRES